MLHWVFPPAALGQSVPLPHGATIGRAEESSIRLLGEGVSRHHAELLREGSALTLRDAGSRNGTFLDGRRVAHAAVREGGVLRIGGWVGIFGRSLPEPEAEFSLIASGLWGGAELQRALEAARRAAPTDLPLLLVGETGTGKERCARALHDWSGRSGPFIAVNCAALPAELAEGELFGYRRGAFTGAAKDNAGYFRSAHRGTLLLDELNELPLGIQAKLLRVIQEQAVTPLGQAQTSPIDVRLMAASQTSLARAVAAGRFRQDLFMRLKGLELELPPLRERAVDVPYLLRAFLSEPASAAPEVDARLIEVLCLYRWPGNVRELALLARQLLAVHGREPVLKLRHLPADIVASALGNAAQPDGAPPAPTFDRASDDLERLAAKLRENGANLSRACAELKISRQRAYRLLAGQSVQEFLASRR